MGWIIAIIGLVVSYFVLRAIRKFRQRRLIPDRYAWLELLDRSEWKTPLQLQWKMGRRVGTTGSLVIELDLEGLEEEDLIESQDHEPDEVNPQDSSDFEYRLTTAGWKKLLERRHPVPDRTLPRTV